MQALARLIGLAIAILGFSICVRPLIVQKLFAFFSAGKNLYYAAAARITAGVILILATPQSILPAGAFVLGVLFILSGAIIFTADLQKLKDFIAHYAGLPPLTVRLLGAIAVCFGCLMAIIA